VSISIREKCYYCGTHTLVTACRFQACQNPDGKIYLNSQPADPGEYIPEYDELGKRIYCWSKEN
jgi:hypothetical protein